MDALKFRHDDQTDTGKNIAVAVAMTRLVGACEASGLPPGPEAYNALLSGLATLVAANLGAYSHATGIPVAQVYDVFGVVLEENLGKIADKNGLNRGH